jgi:hypothetical protein
MSGWRSAAASSGGVGGRVIPDQDDGPVEFLVRRVEQAGITGLGEPLAPVLSARRDRFAAICDTRRRFATSWSLVPASTNSAAASHTLSRRARSAAVSPSRSGYLMVLA